MGGVAVCLLCPPAGSARAQDSTYSATPATRRADAYGVDPDKNRDTVHWGTLANWGTHQYVYCRSADDTRQVAYYSALFDAGTDKDETDLASKFSRPFASSLAGKQGEAPLAAACSDDHDKYLIEARLKRDRYADLLKGWTVEPTRWTPSRAVIVQP